MNKPPFSFLSCMVHLLLKLLNRSAKHLKQPTPKRSSFWPLRLSLCKGGKSWRKYLSVDVNGRQTKEHTHLAEIRARDKRSKDGGKRMRCASFSCWIAAVYNVERAGKWVQCNDFVFDCFFWLSVKVRHVQLSICSLTHLTMTGFKKS